MSKKVLIADDSVMITQLVGIILKKEGFDVESINDGAKVAAAAKAGRPDLVILDLMMPFTSGLDVFRQLKADPATRDIPLMLLSAKTDALKWEAELRASDAFVTKPFDNDKLLAEVKRLLKA
jgi:DNA-binding response OmpR family regulator